MLTYDTQIHNTKLLYPTVEDMDIYAATIKDTDTSNILMRFHGMYTTIGMFRANELAAWLAKNKGLFTVEYIDIRWDNRCLYPISKHVATDVLESY